MCWMLENILKNNFLINWLIAIGTIGLAILVVFQDKIHAWLKRPILEIDIKLAPPDCHKTFIAKQISLSGEVDINTTYADCYYFRLRVKNNGKSAAEMVEVFASELSKQKADGSFKKLEYFLPMRFMWSHIYRPFFDVISPGFEKNCDLAHIIDPKRNHFFDLEEDPRIDLKGKTFLSLDLEVKPYTMSHLIQPGIYQLKLIIGSSNTKPVEKILEINHTGAWFADEEKMLTEGIGIKVIG